jgi:uncharacterized protein YaaW (UPF0174 family)
MEIYRKPTTTGITINNKSCQPREQNYKNWIHRLLTLPFEENAKNKELNTVTNIALNNSYRKEDIIKLHNKLKQKINKSDNKVGKEQNGLPLLIQETTYEKLRNY